MRKLLATILLSTMMASTAFGQIVVPGADGSDGAFNPTSNTTIDLSLAPDGVWNGSNTSPGNGVYDPSKMAIVFRYSSVNIPAGVNVYFRNHDWNNLKAGNPPVVWLVSGSITINGSLYLSSAGLDALNMGSPGPGGFRGAGRNGSMSGLGPGGGLAGNCQAYFGNGAYGNPRCLPLIGGSGGGYYDGGNSGGGGGGAILLASAQTITLNGGVDASAYWYCGCGGAIRVVCHRLEGSGGLAAVGQFQWGRIRIEANQVAFGSTGNPVASFGLPGATATLWPDDATDPSVRVVSLTGIPIPADPAARFDFPAADLNVTNGTGQQLLIEAKNVPTGSDPPGVQAWNVVARAVPRGSAPFTVNATLAGGNYATSTWTATLNMPTGFSAVQVRASMPPQ